MHRLRGGLYVRLRDELDGGLGYTLYLRGEWFHDGESKKTIVRCHIAAPAVREETRRGEREDEEM
jgi:hypothetical protein